MGNKKIVNLLSILFVITFLLAVVGYLNKDKYNNTNNQGSKNSEKIVKVDYFGKEENVSSLENKFEGAEFVKANKNSDYPNIKARIENDVIKVSIDKSVITNASEDTPQTVEYTIEDVKSLKAVQARVLNNVVKVSMLDNNNRLYLSVFNANPGENQGITTYEYNIDNIDCFAIMNKPIFENATLEQLYVVFKTKDGTYYTDFQFEENVEVTISKINNIIDSENANVYIDEVGIPIDENDFEAINDYNEEIEDYEEEIINEEIEEEILNDEFNEEAE